MRRRFFLIANPGAGLIRSPLVEEVVQALRRAGAEVVSVSTDSPQSTRQEARKAGISGRYDAIVAAGGDGTIRQVAAGIIGTDVPLGVVPVGTGNVLAHEIGLVRDPDAVLRMLLYGPHVNAACASVNDEPFLLMAGAGFDGRVIAALDHRFKSQVGKAAYAGPVLGALVRPMDVLTVSVDGHRYEASWVVVANARHYGGRFVMASRTDVQKRGLQAILFKAKNRAVLIGQLMSLAKGTLDARCASHGDVEIVACSRATITSRHPVPAQIDGDAFGSTPIEVHEGTALLPLIVPPREGRSSIH